jgi:D-inositol-3-phosphate glycosyltransferase
MKIAIIEPIGGHGGNDLYDVNLVCSISMSENCHAVLYTCEETVIDGRGNIKLTFKNIYGRKNKYSRTVNYILGTFRSLIDAQKCKATIVHLHFFGFSPLEYINVFMAKKLFGFKTVATVHDVESFETSTTSDGSKTNVDRFLQLLDGVVVHTEYARRELVKHISPNVLGTKRIKTIYACDLDYESMGNNRIEKKIARDYLGLPQNRKIILFFGQIKKVKGLEVLLEALTIAIKEEPSILLVIAGKVWKDNFANYERIIKSNGLDPYIDRRIGFISNSEVPYFFNSADVVVLPYRKIYNSGVLIRAMSFGTPVLASNFGPFKEFIEDGVNGFLFQTDNPQSLATKLKEMFDEETSLEKISQAEIEFISKYFALNEIGRQYRELYQEIS